MKKIWTRINRDIKTGWQPALIIGGYILFMNGLLRISVCPFRGITGLPCPACGMTRAGFLFLEGRFREAFLIHPFIYPAFLMAVIFVLFRYLLGRSTLWMQWPLILLGIGLFLFYFYRMSLLFPETEPMTYTARSVFGILGVWERLGISFAG